MQRDLSDSRSFIRILRHEPPFHSTSLASEFQLGETYAFSSLHPRSYRAALRSL